MQEVFKVLADGQRREILRLLKNAEMNVTEISEHLGLTTATVSHHLSKLSAVELVLKNRKKQKIYYRLRTSLFEDLANFFMEFFKVDGDK